ncbi:tubulin-specific chaperone [Aspergillus steynii IBT 23096]|uniref:Tubulin-specific chaperone E n=1 Tax=Aspergillus steynii IBT 23096 TaxID=1392250 RepID=A0A2I2GQF5_9EURO|nr:tubulin-specific chaperone [Aspergillus steynii IBT 23096]PLB55113.1 tubulin-specific chaperone [Aspergillus steynii IBT 23096]
MNSSCHLGQRRSYNGDLCTVRYIGKVEGTTGEWLGVEWDDSTRGKHSGEHQGVRYFTCKSKQPTAGSFVRPSRASDKPRGFLEALREKYASGLEQVSTKETPGGNPSEDSRHKPIEISGKVVEEVGFDKIRKQLAELQELRIVLLDGLCVAGALPGAAEHEQVERARKEIQQTCPKITGLDLSRNLLTSWTDVQGICAQLKGLNLLKLNCNRFDHVEEGLKFEGISELHLDDTLLAWDEISSLAYQFPSVTTLSACANQISTLSRSIPNTVTSLALELNDISSLSSIKHLASLPNLKHLSLRGNCINAVYDESWAGEPLQFSPSLTSVDLSRNNINTWSFVDELSKVFPGLQVLRISGNPLYDQPIGPSVVTGMPEKPMTVDEAYMLTLSRLASLQVLNYGKINAKDRSNGELYYLSLIGKELSANSETAELEILAKHPRYNELCKVHGEPIITRASDSTRAGTSVNPRSVAARLVKMVFHLRSDNSQTSEIIKAKEVPRSFDAYQLKAIASRLFDLPPYECRLVWETDELDPVSKANMEDADGWDSEEEIADGGKGVEGYPHPSDDTKFVKREVELVDSTKDIGFWFQPDLIEARVRVEVAPRS